MTENKIAIVLIGAPGSGKGTHAAYLQQNFPQLHSLSVGNLLRIAGQNDQKIKAIIDQGLLVPDEVSLLVIAQEFSRFKETSGFIIYGFPRSIGQAQKFDNFLIDQKISLVAVIELKTDNDKILQNRIINRQNNRQDDKDLKVIQERIQLFRHNISDLVSHYSNQNLYYEIDSSLDLLIVKRNIKELVQKLLL